MEQKQYDLQEFCNIANAKIKEKTNFDQALDFIDTALKLSTTATNPQVFELSARMIKDLRTSPQNWAKPRAMSMKIDEVDTDIWMYSTNVFKSKIYFYESKLLDDQDVPTKVTHAVIDNGDYKLDVLTLLPLDKVNMNELFIKVENKIRGLQNRVQNIEKNLLITQEALKSDKGPEALNAIENAMAFIGIRN